MRERARYFIEKNRPLGISVKNTPFFHRKNASIHRRFSALFSAHSKFSPVRLIKTTVHSKKVAHPL